MHPANAKRLSVKPNTVLVALVLSPELQTMHDDSESDLSDSDDKSLNLISGAIYVFIYLHKFISFLYPEYNPNQY